MTLHDLKTTLRKACEADPDLTQGDANKLERQAYRDARDKLSEHDQDVLDAAALRLRTNIKLKGKLTPGKTPEIGENAMLELLANIAPFLGGENV